MFILKRNITGHFSCQRLRKAVQSNNFFATQPNIKAIFNSHCRENEANICGEQKFIVLLWADSDMGSKRGVGIDPARQR